MILFAVVIALQTITGSAAATTFYVDDDGPGNYTTIQSVLKSAVPEDTIIVNPCICPQTVTVNTPVTIKGSSGYPTVDGFYINVPTYVGGFTITKVFAFDQAGGSGITRNNRFNGCGIGISTNYLCGNETIMNNVFTDSPVAISTYDSVNNRIIGKRFKTVR